MPKKSVRDLPAPFIAPKKSTEVEKPSRTDRAVEVTQISVHVT